MKGAVLIFVSFFMIGCSADMGKADGTREGTEEGSRAGTDAGYRDGVARGSQAGRERARGEARRGEFWEVYLRPAAIAAIAGVFLGIAIQVVLLTRLRHSKVSESVAVFFVPGLAESEAYRRWAAIRSLKAAAEERLLALHLDHQVQVKAMNRLRSLVEEYIRSSQRIGDLNRRRLVELFDVEAQRIIDEARTKIRKAS